MAKQSNFITGFIEPKKLDEQSQAMCDVMAATYPITSRWAAEVYGLQEPEFQRFRQDYLKGVFRDDDGNPLDPQPVIPVGDREAMNVLHTIESDLLPYMAMLIAKWAKSFHRSKTAEYDYDDYFQEGMVAYSNCIWGYSGVSEFGTYLTWAVKRQFVNMSRLNFLMSAVAPSVKDRVNEVVAMKRDQGLTLDEAIERLDVNPSEAVSIIRAMSDMSTESAYCGTDGNKFSLSEIWDQSVAKSLDDIAEGRKLMEIYQNLELNDFERDIMDSMIDGVPGFLAAAASRHLNRKTGKPFTRMTACNVFADVKRKILEAYNESKGEFKRLRMAA